MKNPRTVINGENRVTEYEDGSVGIGHTTKDPKTSKTDIKLIQFLKWFKYEFKDVSLKVSDYGECISFLNGLQLGMKVSDPNINKCIEVLKGAETFVKMAKIKGNF